MVEKLKEFWILKLLQMLMVYRLVKRIQVMLKVLSLVIKEMHLSCCMTTFKMKIALMHSLSRKEEERLWILNKSSNQIKSHVSSEPELLMVLIYRLKQILTNRMEVLSLMFQVFHLC